MPKKKSNFVKLACPVCKQINYYINKSKGKTAQPEKLELNKFCRHCRKHTEHKEVK